MWLGVEMHGGSKHFVFFSNTEPGVMCVICACGMLGDEQVEPHAGLLPWGPQGTRRKGPAGQAFAGFALVCDCSWARAW
jgi:hypothetical protein